MREKERLEELNRQCMKCQKDARKRFESPDYMNCGRLCPIGKEIHSLEEGGWGDIDWNSARWEKLYRH